MSVRGPRGGRGHGTGRGRGRGGKMTTWEWHNNHSPGPEIYNQLWHIRRQPATVTPFLPTECPLHNVRTRIVDRRQTEGKIQRNFYVVEATESTPREASGSSTEDARAGPTQIYHVDLSRILEYVSPSELERFENEQFRVEAEAEAVAMRIEADTLKQKRLAQNARSAGAGPGSNILDGFGSDFDARSRGRSRGRGRRRGRGRGSWRARGAHVISGHSEDMRENLVDAETERPRGTEEEMTSTTVTQTDSEEEDLAAKSLARASPTAARSAFVTNSALSASSDLSHRRRPGAMTAQQEFDSTLEESQQSDLDPHDRDARSISSAAMQLRLEDDACGRSDATLEDNRDRHRSKRCKTESAASSQRPPPAKSTSPKPQRIHLLPSFVDTMPVSSVHSEASSDSRPAQQPAPVHGSLRNGHSDLVEVSNRHMQSPAVEAHTVEQSSDNDETEEEDEEEYVAEAIIEHYRKAGKKYYLVKWQDREGSHDWVSEEDLEGAAELVAEYNNKLHRRMMEATQKRKK